ncbi:unnamed protein product [Mycena citricolor]|uniref:Succinate dehydrogenase assembly factor 3 n=1 Tax=Mycena citricolor TaxID=2018698 RepID=A0AAD2HN27_9AGAR|nr:unnamed protein product [Mycena citricolor]
MRASLFRLAENISQHPIKLAEVSSTLLPPITLYRGILRAHRHLPQDLRFMGDGYVKAEFHRHQNVTNPVHLMGFLVSWKAYLDEIPTGPGGREGFRGKKLDPTVFDKMSKEQLGQLYELLQATKELR